MLYYMVLLLSNIPVGFANRQLVVITQMQLSLNSTFQPSFYVPLFASEAYFHDFPTTTRHVQLKSKYPPT